MKDGSERREGRGGWNTKPDPPGYTNIPLETNKVIVYIRVIEYIRSLCTSAHDVRSVRFNIRSPYTLHSTYTLTVISHSIVTCEWLWLTVSDES